MKVKFLLLILPFLLVFSCTGEKAEKNGTTAVVTGKIIAMDGAVDMDGKPAETGDTVQNGAVISTTENGYCEIQFLGSNIIRIFEDSILKISFKDSTITLDRGAAAAVLRNISSLIQSMDDVFSIRSGAVVAGIRGTSFYVKREDADTAYFCLCNGEIHLEDSEGQFSQNLKNTHHGAVRITEKNRQIEVRKAPMLYHTDRDMEALASTIGQTMDWTRVESSH